MKSSKLSVTISAQNIGESIIINENIAVLQIRTVINGKDVVPPKYMYCHPSNIAMTLSKYAPEQSEKYKRLCLVTKENLEVYMNYPYGSDEYRSMEKTLMSAEKIYEYLQTHTATELIPIWYDISNGCMYPYCYEAEENYRGYYKHPVKINGYEIWSGSYNLNEVSKIVAEGIAAKELMVYNIYKDRIISEYIYETAAWNGNNQYMVVYALAESAEQEKEICKKYMERIKQHGIE